MKTITIQSEEEMFALAQEFAQSLKAGDVVELVGDLGAGKTTFVRGVMKVLNPEVRVKSPTFTVMNEYPVESGDIQKVVHLDLYRFENPEELGALELEQYIDAGAVLFVEWPNVFNVPIFEGARRVEIEHLEGEKRKVKMVEKSS